MNLIERLRAREPAAFNEAYEAHRRTLWGFLRRLSGDALLADDLFQETWIQLVRHAPKLRDDSNLGAWLCVVGRNQYLKHRRFVLVDDERLRSLRWALAGEDPPVGVAHDIEAALAALPLADREILLLHAESDLGQDALAAMMGIGYSVFRQRLARARQRLAKLLPSEVEND